MKRANWILLLVLFACSPTQDNQKHPDIISGKVISDVSIINLHDGSINPHQYVVIKDDKITSIQSSAEGTEGMQVIDGKGKFLMPGLAELHAHIPSPKNGREFIEQTLFLYLSNGITTIRGMLGHPIHLEMREQALKQEIISPRIFTSSPSLNGRSVQTPEEARIKINDYADAGYDFLKLHPGIKDEVFDEIVKVAGERNIGFAGHVSVDVGIRKALRSRYESIDHVDGYLEGLVPDEANVDPSANGFFGYNFTALADTSRISELVEMTREYKVWIIPTQSLFDRWFSPEEASVFAEQEEMKYMWKSTLDQWVESKASLTGDESYSAEQWQAFNSIRQKLILELHRGGQGLVLGSDAPQVFNVPGFSIHHELQSMLDAGLTPLEALQTGTLNAALYFDQEGNWGEVKTGFVADLVLLDKNPLKNMNNLKNPAGVMVRGRWISRDFIQKELAKIAEDAATR